MKILIPKTSLVILCGPAACGKSTFARQHFRRTAVVSSDRCRAMLTDSEHAIWASPQAFELFHLILDKRLRFGRLAVADSTALSKDARRTLRRIARNNGRPTVLIVFNIDRVTCLEQDRSRRRRVGTEIVDKHSERLAEVLNEIRHETHDAVYILNQKDVYRAKVIVE